MKRLVFGLLLAACVGGCAAPGVDVSLPGAEAPEAVSVDGQDRLPSGAQELRVMPQDVLQVDVYPRKVSDAERKTEYGNELRIELVYRDEDYRITRGDLLSVELGPEGGKTYDVGVLPNGRVRLPRIDKEMRAVGLRPAELADAMSREYGALLLKPRVQVNVQRSGLDELSKLSGNYTVDRDGRILLPKLGALPALGLTTAQIARSVAEAASAYYANRIEAKASLLPFVSRPADERLAPDGQQYFRNSVKVAPDGSIFVPDAGLIPVAGKTIEEVNRDVQQAVAGVYRNPVDVRVSLQESPSLMVFIGGEVRAPGRYPLQGARTLLQLINTAGWVTDTADLSEIVLLHAQGDNQYVRYRTNLAEVVDGKARLRQDLKLSPRDIVIVPKSGIAKMDLWMDQYIRRLLPFGMAVNYVISDVHYSNQPSPLDN